MDADVIVGREPTPEGRCALEEALAAGYDGAVLHADGSWTGLRATWTGEPGPAAEGG